MGMDLAATPSLMTNEPFWCGVLAWTLAQGFKFVRKLIKDRTADFRCFVSTGGMPSAHSALVSALGTSVGLHEGFGSTLFAVTAIFALIVMFDAQGVRRAAGSQARVLNQIVDELVRQHHWPRRAKLAELLGHSRHEVFVGMALGVATGFGLHEVLIRVA